MICYWRPYTIPSSDPKPLVTLVVPRFSVRIFRLSYRLALIFLPRRLISAWYLVGLGHNATRVSMSVHVSSDIHMFCLAAHMVGFGMDSHISENRMSPCVFALVGGLIGKFIRLPSYFRCFLAVALTRQPRIMTWSDLCCRSWIVMFQNQWWSVPSRNSVHTFISHPIQTMIHFLPCLSHLCY